MQYHIVKFVYVHINEIIDTAIHIKLCYKCGSNGIITTNHLNIYCSIIETTIILISIVY